MPLFKFTHNLQVKHVPKERNFRKHSLSPQQDEDLYNPELPSEDNYPSPDIVQGVGEENHNEVKAPSNKHQRSRSPSKSPSPSEEARKISKSPKQEQGEIGCILKTYIRWTFNNLKNAIFAATT